MAASARRVILKKHFLKESGEKGRSAAKMDDANRAMCYALRHPPAGGKPMKLGDIQKLVRKTDRTIPGIAAIAEAADNFKKPKGQRGRPQGSKKTTKKEDKLILTKFHKLRPPGHGINSGKLRRSLPKKLQKKIGRRTIIRNSGVSTNSGIWQNAFQRMGPPTQLSWLATYSYLVR
jgi:hypothetical protein